MEIHRNPHSLTARIRQSYEDARTQASEENQGRVREARAELARLSELRGRKFRALRSQGVESRGETTARTPEADSTRSTRGGDSLEISERARALAQDETRRSAQAEEASEAEANERLEALKIAYREGTLSSPERAKAAAQNLLGGSTES